MSQFTLGIDTVLKTHDESKDDSDTSLAEMLIHCIEKHHLSPKKVVNINIDSLVDSININVDGLKKGMDEPKDKISKALRDAIDSTEEKDP